MRKTLLAAAALLSLSAPASAYSTFTTYDGNTYASSCYHGFYGWRCRSWVNGTGNSALSVRVPANMEFNTNPAWGRPTADLPNGCRSCADVSK
jgi:hypothetical protein